MQKCIKESKPSTQHRHLYEYILLSAPFTDIFQILYRIRADESKSIDFFGTLLFSLSLAMPLLCFTLLYFTLLYFTLLCFALLCFALLCFALLYFALLCFALLAFHFPLALLFFFDYLYLFKFIFTFYILLSKFSNQYQTKYMHF